LPALTADANYYNRAHWKIVPVEGQPGKVLIESCHTGRYLFEASNSGDVSSKREAEGGWIHKNNLPALTADANYYNRAHWKINAVPHVAKVIRQSLPNVKDITRADDVPHLWAAVDTAGVAGVPIAFIELTWVDQGQGFRKGHLYARKDGGAWVGISTDAAEHELTRESFEIPARVLGGKLELGYSVGHGGGHKLIITDAEVELTERKCLITVDVGPHSGPCPKVVTLPSAGLQVSSTPVGPQHADWNDKFRVEVEGNLLKVFRVDDGRPANAGWAQELVLGAMITVDVGPHSGPCPKVITLPSAGLQVSSTPFNPQQQLVQGSGANATTYYADNWTDIDTFRVEVEGNLLKVFRVDRPNAGWSQRLVLSAM